MGKNKKRINKNAAGVLSILFGHFGIGHFYTGQILRGVLDIIFCWTTIPTIIGIVEGVVWLCESENEFQERVSRWQRN